MANRNRNFRFVKFSIKTDQSNWKSIDFDWISVSVGFFGFLFSKKANKEKKLTNLETHKILTNPKKKLTNLEDPFAFPRFLTTQTPSTKQSSKYKTKKKKKERENGEEAYRQSQTHNLLP